MEEDGSEERRETSTLINDKVVGDSEVYTPIEVSTLRSLSRLGRTVSWRDNNDRECAPHRRVQHERQYVGRIPLQQGFRDTVPAKCDSVPNYRM